jgi:hypothetical protein
MNPIFFSSAGDNLGQLITMAICVGICFRWMRLWRTNWRVRPFALYPVIIAVLTLVFYAVVLFTDLNEQNRILFTFISTMLRLFVMAILLLAGYAMEKPR